MGCKEVRFRMVYRFKDCFTVNELCRLLNVSRSGYYKWLSRGTRPDRDELIAKLIRQCHSRTRRTYGYRRVKIWLLRETGLVINHKAVLRIMRKYDLLALHKKKRFHHYKLDTYHHYENLLKRDFSASKPNEKWVTDISYIPTSEGFLYLSVIKDLYDKSIVAYRYAMQMPTKLVTDTIHAALKSTHPDDQPILHSDNGFQYASMPYYHITKKSGITPSMSAVGCPYDNACVESFFSLLKNECIYRAKPKTIRDAMELIDDYIYFYNNERIQLSSKMTPMEVRLLAA